MYNTSLHRNNINFYSKTKHLLHCCDTTVKKLSTKSINLNIIFCELNYFDGYQSLRFINIQTEKKTYWKSNSIFIKI